MKTNNSFVILIFIVFLLHSCKENSYKSYGLNGIWESIGSGWILQIQDSTNYAIYDITSVSCLPSREASLDELKKYLSLKEDTLLLKRGVMTYKFARSNKLPDICNSKISEEKQYDPLYNFEVFAQTVETHYAFMDLNAIDWKSMYSKYKSQLSKNPTEKELYKILDEILELLNDNHAYLEATEAFYETLEDSTENTNSDSQDTHIEYGDFQVADMVAKHFLVEDMTDDSWLIKWGKMKDNIGFIQIKAMWLYADLDIAEEFIKEHGYVDAYVKTFNAMAEGEYIDLERKGVNKIMDKVMKDLKETKSIVVDVRFNGGGQDAVNFEILKRFNTQNRHIVNTKLKMGSAYSPLLKLYIEAGTTPYTKPVYILTSQQTGSAAESFAIGSMSIPNIKRIGSKTQGALSTSLEKNLPNGWVFSISNEVYMDTQNLSYENRGVPPDIVLNYPEDRQAFFRSVVNDLEKDKADILKAIKSFEDR